MKDILKSVKWQSTLSNLDDIVVFSGEILSTQAAPATCLHFAADENIFHELRQCSYSQ